MLSIDVVGDLEKRNKEIEALIRAVYSGGFDGKYEIPSEVEQHKLAIQASVEAWGQRIRELRNEFEENNRRIDILSCYIV